MEIDIKNEKVKRIVKAAYEEFAHFGKKKASLNNILKEAQISKGVFYHYFESKEDLYGYLIHFMVSKTYEVMNSQQIFSRTDVLQRLAEAIYVKLEIMQEYYGLDFINVLDRKDIERIANDYFEDDKAFRERFYHENIDFSVLKADVDSQKFTMLAHHTLKQITSEWFKSIKEAKYSSTEFEQLKRLIDEYIDFIKLGYYK